LTGIFRGVNFALRGRISDGGARMQPLLKQYLDGTLSSSGSPQLGQVEVKNDLAVPLWAGFLAADGSVYPAIGVPANSTASGSRPINWYWLIWALDGSLAAVFPGVAPPNKLSILIGAAGLSSPGDIGPVPTPTVEIPIPNDSPSILVGAAEGQDSGGGATYLTRSQFWKRSGDSITLAPNEKVTTGYTSMTGIQETSSETETVAKAVNASLSAGWGPVSASLSASLNTSNTSFQQYVSTQTDTRFESRAYEGDPANTRMIFRWQLYDVVTISSAAGDKVLAQVTTAQHPDVVKVYSEQELASKPGPELSEADRRELSELLAGFHAGGDAR
jgi:hypothetical protein